MTTTFKPSVYQEGVFGWVRTGSGDAVINAVAGSGKTTTLLESLRYIHGTVILLAFNAHIAKEIQNKIAAMGLTHVEVKTIHSLGYGAIAFSLPKGKRVNVQEYKYKDIAQTMFQDRNEANRFADLLDKVRVSLTSPTDTEAVWDLIAHHNIEDITAEMVAALPQALATGVAMGRVGVIDFTDMIWLPTAMGLQPRKFDFVLVDEAQDLSPAQLELVLKARSKGGRMLFVGDPFQSIYGFAGADCNSFYNIKERLNAMELPLSINYRCHTKALDLARKIVPHIEARPDAPEGIVETIKAEDLADKAQEGDLVLCRLTAPLIKECIKMIRHRKPARVRGRDIAKSLTSIVKKVAKANYGKFDLDLLTVWSGKEQEKIQRAKHHEAALEAHNDRIQGIQVCFETFGCETVEDFCNEIESLFSDGRASVMLSTIHRAKGLEENRVFIIVPEKLPLTWKGQRDWEFQQEMNLKYVALTRPKNELYFVESEK